jgi:hypothetical protein
MKFVLFVICALLLTACGSKGTQAPTPSETTVPKAAIAIAEPTETPVPTATIDYQATIAVVQQAAQDAQQQANQAQAEADAQRRLMVDATVTHEAVMLIAAQMTQSSEVLSAQGTQVAVNATASAYPTSIPLTATQQMTINSVRETQQAANDPKFIEKRANAEAYAQNAGKLMMVEIGLKWAVALFVITLGMALVIFVMRAPNNVPSKDTNQEIHIEQLKKIPMVADSENRNRTIRAEVLCTNEQIVDLANGILNMKMTLGFNQWQGTSVHKNLKEIRDFFQEHKFARLIPGKGGELIVTSEGEEFLIECWNLKEPPLPFRCIIPSPGLTDGLKLAPVI